MTKRDLVALKIIDKSGALMKHPDHIDAYYLDELERLGIDVKAQQREMEEGNG